MDNNFYAVLIGFNKFKDEEHLPSLQFAEKDAQDLYDVLLNPQIGNYPPKNVVLITNSGLHIDIENGDYPPEIVSLARGDILPESLETDHIETILYTHVVKNRRPDDIVLVYYSGHGFIAGDNRKVFLGTPDVPIVTILNNPKAGLQMEYLHNEIFMKSKAKFVIFLLDCCHSGAFCPSFKGDEQLKQKKLVEDRFFSGEGRVAFVSSPSGITSRESQQFQNGIFTHYLLKGLRGEAKEPYSEELTMGSLVSYVQAMSPSSQPPVLYGKSTRVVIMHPEILDEATKKPVYKVYDEFKLKKVTEQTPAAVHFDSPLDKHIEYIDKVLSCLSSISYDDNLNLGERILSSVRSSLDAEFAFILRVEHDKDVVYKFQSDSDIKEGEPEEYKYTVMSNIYPLLIRQKSELLPTKYGFYKPFEGHKDVGKYLLVIPLRVEYPREFMVLCGVGSAYLQFGEILGRTLISLYHSTSEFTSFQLSKIETALLDDLKRDFGHVPYQIYTRRFSKFRESLHNVIFFYEPVIDLGKKSIEIDSWEALARDPDTKKAPFELFQAAELWGPEFITELDLYCLRNAIETYRQVWKEERKAQKYDPLAVNVYPETLFRLAYKRELAKIVKEEELIRSQKLTIEISEKRPLSSAYEIRDDMPSTSDPVERFMQAVREYTSDLNIRFAIDDFGVEHSSVARLARLELDYVKIDRDILRHPHPDCTIAYVRDIVNRSHFHPTKIVVEGFDGDSRIPLSSLYNLGIQYVQGHLIRRASPTVNDLEQEKQEFLLREVNR